jgi:hypothetical protein
MAEEDRLKNNKNIYKEAQDNYNKMTKDVVKFCLELGWGCWIDNKKLTPGPRKENK